MAGRIRIELQNVFVRSEQLELRGALHGLCSPQVWLHPLHAPPALLPAELLEEQRGGGVERQGWREPPEDSTSSISAGHESFLLEAVRQDPRPRHLRGLPAALDRNGSENSLPVQEDFGSLQ